VCFVVKRPGLAEIQAGLRLGQAIRSASSTDARKRAVLLGLCEILDGHSGVCVMLHCDLKGRRKTILSIVSAAIDEPRPTNVPLLSVIENDILALEDGDPERSTFCLIQTADSKTQANPGLGENDQRNWRSRTFSRGACVHSILHLGATGLTASLRICSPKKRYGARHRAIVDLVHHEIGWIYRSDLPLASPEAMALSPRQRDVLGLLLNGDGEKQIAGKLKLSHNTVHHHVKGIHRHFGVSSRSELLARWVGK
jgi:DNA-binding CsgD family transcriptional regulator